MAHEVEQMAYRGETPWHGLGNKISENSTIEQWQEAAGLNWEVQKHPVHYTVDDKHFTYKDKFVLARTTDNHPYAIVSTRYRPVQPKEILEFFRDLLARHNMKIETAGSLKNGAKIWAMATTGDAYKVSGIDPLLGYLNIATSYDLSFSTVAYFTSVRVVCNNTLQASFGDMTNAIRIPHFKEFNIEDVHTKLELGRENWQAFTQAVECLNKIKLDMVTAKKVLDYAYKLPEDMEMAMADSNKVHANNVYTMFEHDKYVGADLCTGTMWGLLNAQTAYIDHIKRARGQGNRLDSAWYGDGFNIKQRTFDKLMELAA